MKSGEMLALSAFLIIVIGVAMAVAGPNTLIGKAWIGALNASHPQSISAPATGSSVVGSPSLSAQQIDTILSNAGSPAAGTGQDLYNLGQKYNIDPAFALAVFFNESNFGKSGEAVNSHSLGNLRCIPGAACVNGYAWFNSRQDGYAAFYKLISSPYYVGSGLTTPETILSKYAPSGDGNDPSHYAYVVNSCISLWRSGSTEVPA